MKIICISIGTRGDIEPFAALAELLAKAGHEVICAFPEQYEKHALETGSQFFPLAKEFLEMLDSATGKMALGGGGSLYTRFQSYYGLYKQNKIISFKLMEQQKELVESEAPDLILHSIKSFFPVIWNISNPGKAILLSPIPCILHPVNEMSSIFLNGKDLGKRINRWTYKIMRKLSMNFIHGQLPRLGFEGITKKELNNSWISEKLIFTISPSLYPPREYWPDHVRVLGYMERNKSLHWTPPKELKAFLVRNTNPLFVTFGSMSNPHPYDKTDFILNVLKRNGIPAIINTAAGGLVEPENYDRENIYFVADIPYDWIFPKVRAVIHHGGAGTTHLALKYGCPSMITPHIPDQHLWNRIVNIAGAGPRGLPISKFTNTATEQKVVDLYTNDEYLKNATRLAQKLSGEDYDSEILDFVIPGERLTKKVPG